MTHVLAYFRQSDEEGAKKQLSIPAQQERFLQDVDGRDVTYELAPWDEGYSGGSLDRPGLQWVLANLDRADELWVYDHDRLVRHPFFGPYVMNEIRSRGIRLWGPWGEDVASPMGRFMTDIRMRFGAYYREEVSDRTKMNRDHRLKEGLWSGHPPTGYKFVFERGEGSRRILVPDPETAPVVQELFRLIAAGVSQKKASAMTGTYPTKVLWQRDNPLYVGLVYKNRENVDSLPDRRYLTLWTLAENPNVEWIYPGRHEALIDAATWDRMQARVAGATRGRNSARLSLAGRFRCDCGRRLRVGHNSGKRHPSLGCPVCHWERSYQFAERTVLGALSLLLHSPELEAAVEAELKAALKEDPEAQLAETNRRRANAVRRLDRTLESMIDAPELSQGLRAKAGALQEEVTALDREVALLKAATRARPVKDWRQARDDLVAQDVEELWRVATPEEQRALVAEVFSEVVAGPELVTFTVPGLPFAIRLEWQWHGMSADRKVAGPGLEPGTP